MTNNIQNQYKEFNIQNQYKEFNNGGESILTIIVVIEN